MGGVKYASCDDRYMVAVLEDGSLCTWGGISPRERYSVPRNVMEGVREIPDSGFVITKDGSLWTASYDRKKNKADVQKITDDVATLIDRDTVEKKDGSKWFYSYDYRNKVPHLEKIPNSMEKIAYSPYVIKKEDGTVWEKTDGNRGSEGFVQLGDGIGGVTDLTGAGGFFLARKQNGSLWMWHEKPRSEDTTWVYEDAIPEDLKRPVKIHDHVVQVKHSGNYAFAVTEDHQLVVWCLDVGYDFVDHARTNVLVPRKVMADVQRFYESDRLMVVKNDDSLWEFDSIDMTWDVAGDKFDESIAKTAREVLKNTKDVVQYKYNQYITRSGELYVRFFTGFEEAEKPLSYEEQKKFFKVMDHVKAADVLYVYGVALLQDGTLWEFGNIGQYWGGAGDGLENTRPRKMLDHITAMQSEGVVGALAEDGSLYMWGNNFAGQLGSVEWKDTRSPQKVMEDVAWFKTGGGGTEVLKKDGSYLVWGRGYLTPSSPVFYTNSPLKTEPEPSLETIQHRPFAAVGVGEDIDVLARIGTPEYQNDPVVVTGEGKRINMKACTGGYYEASIPAGEAEGIVRYRIQARSKGGKTVESKEYQVQVVSNDCLYMDADQQEVVSPPISWEMGGEKSSSSLGPVMKEQKVFIPVRELAQRAGYEVGWNENTRTVTFKKGEDVFSIDLRGKAAKKNGRDILSNVETMSIDNSVFAPADCIFSLFNKKYVYDAESKTLKIN